MHEPTPEDMAAAKEQGDLVDMLLATTGRSRKKAKAVEPEAPKAPAGFGPLHRPGSWPFGIGNPGPNTCHPDCGCAIKPKPPDGSQP